MAFAGPWASVSGGLWTFMAARFAALPDHLHMRPVAAPREVIIGRLEVEADEM
jgi:hypothetical protein